MRPPCERSAELELTYQKCVQPFVSVQQQSTVGLHIHSPCLEAARPGSATPSRRAATTLGTRPPPSPWPQQQQKQKQGRHYPVPQPLQPIPPPPAGLAASPGLATLEPRSRTRSTRAGKPEGLQLGAARFAEVLGLRETLRGSQQSRALAAAAYRENLQLRRDSRTCCCCSCQLASSHWRLRFRVMKSSAAQLSHCNREHAWCKWRRAKPTPWTTSQLCARRQDDAAAAYAECARDCRNQGMFRYHPRV